jgi:putative RNA 2'-phosphotransferase
MDTKRLSKTISHALRHHPEEYGLTLDAEGCTPVEDLLAALSARRRVWRDLSESDLDQMMAQADKQRYEKRDGKIRAFYGHSMPDKIQKPEAVPPPVLYHGTAPNKAELILREGLKSMNRQYVHRSTDQATAQCVGARHSPTLVILEIRAVAAHEVGIAFYPGNEDIWLADTIPPEFILDPRTKME